MKKRNIIDITPSCFGTTTIANRAKKNKISHSNGHHRNNSDGGVGAMFLRMDYDNVLTDSNAISLLKSSIKSRLKFEAWSITKLAEQELEAQRLLQVSLYSLNVFVVNC